MTIAPDSTVRPIVSACDTIYGGMTLPQAVAWAEGLGHNIVAATNADFGYWETRIPCGMVVEDGIYKSSPDTNSVLAFGPDGAFLTDYMRSLAARFSGETNVPISTLGVIHDQPASAEAIYAASEPLIIECEDFNDGARESLRNLALMCLAGETDTPLDELPAEARDFTPNFRNPAMPSVVSQTDAMVKIAAVVPEFAGTDVFFEQLGFGEDMRRKAEAEIERNRAGSLLNAIVGASDAEL